MEHSCSCAPHHGAPAASPFPGSYEGRRTRRSRMRRAVTTAVVAGLSGMVVILYAAGAAAIVLTMFSPARAEPNACKVRALWDLVEAVEI